MQLRLNIKLLIISLIHPTSFSSNSLETSSDSAHEWETSSSNVTDGSQYHVQDHTSKYNLSVENVFSHNDIVSVNGSVPYTEASSCKLVPPCACQGETGIIQLQPLAQLLAKSQGVCLCMCGRYVYIGLYC